MRPALVIGLIVVVGSPALGEDARVEYLDRQLKGAKDARVRAQTLLLMGRTGSASTVVPLCAALKDDDGAVRAAAANALGDLRLAASVDCLKAALPAAAETERPAVERALEQGAVESGALYLSLDPIDGSAAGVPDGTARLAEKLLRDKLSSMGASFAPRNEEKGAAQALVRSRNLKSYQLKVHLLPGATPNAMKVEMMIMTYPEQALKGSWNVKASGPKPESLLKAMMPRIVDDAAGDLEWKH